MAKRELFDIDHDTLRDNARPARVERIWRRIESNIAAPVVKKQTRSATWILALAAGLCLGFVLGHEYPGDSTAPASPLVAEPPALEAAGPREPERADEGRRRTEEHKPAQKRLEQQHPRVRRATPLEEPGEQFEPSVPIIEAPASPVVARPPAPALWLDLADRGEYQHAYHSLEEYGGFDAVLLNASADELMILVDVARATGNRGRAIQALRRVTESFVSDPNAPIAAMTLGRMLMQAGDTKGASEAFSLYRRLSPEGDFAEDALASDIQAAVEEGNWDRAETLAKQYESDFPGGRHLEQIREQLKSTQQADGSGSEHEETAPEEPKQAPELAPAPVESPY